jgi:phage-related protein
MAAMAPSTVILGLDNTTLTDSYDDLGFTAAVTGGDVIVIDCAEETVTLNGANKMSGFSGDFFRLEPGNNTIQLTVSGGVIGSVVTTWRERWL